MDKGEREGAIKRILALMAKTTTNGCTEEEALAATKKVTELLNKYQLDLSDLEIKQSKCIKDSFDNQVRDPGHFGQVAVAIGKLCDVKVWQDNSGPYNSKMYHYFGLEHDVIVAKYITAICDRAVTFGWEDFKSSSETWRHGGDNVRKLLKNSYQLGICTRLYDRILQMKIEQQKENVASSGRDLVVVKGAVVTEEFAKLNLHLIKGRKKKTGDIHGGAWAAGRSDADKVNFNKGVGANTKDYLN